MVALGGLPLAVTVSKPPPFFLYLNVEGGLFKVIVPSASASRVSGIDGSSTRAGGIGMKGGSLELEHEQTENKSAKAATSAEAILKTFFMPKLYHNLRGLAREERDLRFPQFFIIL